MSNKKEIKVDPNDFIEMSKNNLPKEKRDEIRKYAASVLEDHINKRQHPEIKKLSELDAWR